MFQGIHVCSFKQVLFSLFPSLSIQCQLKINFCKRYLDFSFYTPGSKYSIMDPFREKCIMRIFHTYVYDGVSKGQGSVGQLAPALSTSYYFFSLSEKHPQLLLICFITRSDYPPSLISEACTVKSPSIIRCANI